MEGRYHLKWLQEQYTNNVQIKFLFFWGHKAVYGQSIGKFCFSQWFERPFLVKGIEYPTAEHWMMAQKAKLFKDEATYQKIIQCKQAGEAKELGRQVLNFDQFLWKKYRYEIVKIGNMYKFYQNRDMGEYLLNTYPRVLVEASPVDIIWGIGLPLDNESAKNVYAWRGLNSLGFALMEVRDFLKENGFDYPKMGGLMKSLDY